MVGTADMSDINRLENLMSDDVDPKWSEPATRGDLRLLAIRIDTKFDQVRGDFRVLTSAIDSKFDQFRGDFRVLTSAIDSKFDQFRGDFRVLSTETDTKIDNFHVEFTRTMYRAGMIFSGAVITTNLAMLGIFATLIR